MSLLSESGCLDSAVGLHTDPSPSPAAKSAKILGIIDQYALTGVSLGGWLCLEDNADGMYAEVLISALRRTGSSPWARAEAWLWTASRQSFFFFMHLDMYADCKDLLSLEVRTQLT